MPDLGVDLYDGNDTSKIFNMTFLRTSYVLKNYFKNNQLLILPMKTNSNEWIIGLNILSEMYTVFDYD